MFVMIHDLDLKIFDYTKPNNPKKIFELLKVQHSLELSTFFEQIWTDLWPQGLDRTQEILYVTSDKAGFTDSRMLFIWIKSWRYFGTDCNYFCARMLPNQPTEITADWLNTIKETSLKNPDDLDYQRDPKITIKPVLVG